MAEDKANTELAPILSLEQYRDQLHPHALERYLRFLGEVRDLLLSGQLTEGELKSYLSQEEQIELGIFEREIAEWLVKCRKDSGEASLLVYPYSMSPYYSMSQFQSLLRTAVERKAKQAAEEAEEKERQVRQEAERERRVAALKEINPPVDAEIYLTPEEQQEFLDSIPGAIDAYLGRDKRAESYSPGIWLLTSAAWDYSYWTSIIEKRKAKEAREKQAQIEYDRYVDKLSLAVEKFKQELAKEKKPKFDYLTELDKYQADGWCDLQLPTKEEVLNWAKRKILEWLPEIMANITKWELSWKVLVLPHAAYESASVPCLQWHFDGHVLVTAELELKTGVIRKHRPEGYSVEVQAKGEKLGTTYLGPREWLVPGTFITPVVLLRLLAEGELEGPGISVTECWPPFLTFAIQGLDEEVEVCDDFVRFIRDISKEKTLVQALLDRDVINQDTAKLVQMKWDEPLPVTVKVTTGSGPDLAAVTAKLMELGWAEPEAKSAVESTNIPENATVEDVVKIVLGNSCGK